jgi:hypothetical protein
LLILFELSVKNQHFIEIRSNSDIDSHLYEIFLLNETFFSLVHVRLRHDFLLSRYLFVIQVQEKNVEMKSSQHEKYIFK